MKKLYWGLLGVLLAAFLTVGVWSLVDRDPTEIASEKREVKKPEFTVSALLDGSYIAQLETYYSDTFPGRDGLMSANKILNKFYHFSGSGENNVLILDYESSAAEGGEGLRHPDDVEAPVETQPETSPVQENKPEEQPDDKPETPPEEEQKPVEPKEPDPSEEVQKPKDPEKADASYGSVMIVKDRAMEIPTATNSIIESYAEAVNNLHEALGENVRVISLVTPNSGQFYSPLDSHTGDHDQQAMIELCYSKMSPDIFTVDAYSKLAAHTEEYIYFRTDHHWTALGAYYAYTAFCETMDLEPVPLEQFETGAYGNFLGSLYSYTSQLPQSEALKNNPDTVEYYLPVLETHAKYYADATLDVGYPVSVVYQSLKEEVGNKYMCFIGGDHPATVIETAADGPVCLVLKESYGNAFVPFLTSHYSKIVVIDPREFNRDGKPSLDLVAFAQEQGVEDLIVINYPFMINNSSYITWLNRLVGIEN